jgi:hypothetical protein
MDKGGQSDNTVKSRTDCGLGAYRRADVVPEGVDQRLQPLGLGLRLPISNDPYFGMSEVRSEVGVPNEEGVKDGVGIG